MKYSHRTPENNKDNSRWLQVYGNCVWIKSEITIKLALRIKWSELGSIGLLNEWIIKTTKKFWTFEVYLKVHPFIHLFFASDFLCHRLFLDWLILELWIYRSECWVIPFVYYFVWEKKKPVLRVLLYALSVEHAYSNAHRHLIEYICVYNTTFNSFLNRAHTCTNHLRFQ